MPSPDPVLRHLLAQVASHSRYAQVPHVVQDLPDPLRARYSAEVDPDNALDEPERLKRARSAWRRDLARVEVQRRKAELALGLHDHDGGAVA